MTNKLFRSKLFWVGLVIRLGLLPFFGAHYMRELFIPFLDGAVQNPGTNPWSLFPPQYFPYGSFLFLLLYIPKQIAFWVFGSTVLTVPEISLALCKLPLLVVDVIFLRALSRFAPQPRLILWYYWLNPVLMFITYVHGQLDVVVTACAFISLLLLLERRTLASAVVMACALSSKFQVALVVPFVIAYMWNRDFMPQSLKKIALWAGVFVALGLLGFAPILTSGNLGYASVTSPEALRVFAAKVDMGQGSVLFFGIAVVMAMLGRLCVSTLITARGLIYGTGLLLSLLVLTTNAMPGWYFWSVPYLALVYANHRTAPRFPWYVFHATYLCFFALLPALGLLPGVLGDQGPGLLFTALQTTFASLLLIVWVVAVREEAKLKRFIKPLMVGIAGDSGVGKNRLSQVLCDVFEVKRTVLIEGDDYHRWERGDDHYARYTHLSPKANNLRALDRHAEHLGIGRMVMQHQYDHRSGRFTAEREIQSGRTVVVQGLHTFYLRTMRDKFDLKVFLAPDELVRLAWKIKRDVEERGYLLSKVLSTIEARRSDSERFIAPQREHADWIIEALPKGAMSRQQVLSGKQPEVVVRHVFWNDAPIIELADELANCPGCEVKLEPSEGDPNRIGLTIVGEPTKEAVASMAHRLFVNLRHVTRGRREPVWAAGTDGIAQLIALTLLCSRSITSEEGGIALGAHQTPGQPGGGSGGAEGPVGSGGGRPVDDGKPGDVASSA